MDKNKLLEMFEAVKDKPYRPSAEWRVAFDYYNSLGIGHLGMGCHPCYGKVLNRIVSELRAMGENIEYVGTVPRNPFMSQYKRRVIPTPRKGVWPFNVWRKENK